MIDEAGLRRGRGEASGERLWPWEERMVRKRIEAGLSFLILKILTLTRNSERELYKKDFYCCEEYIHVFIGAHHLLTKM